MEFKCCFNIVLTYHKNPQDGLLLVYMKLHLVIFRGMTLFMAYEPQHDKTNKMTCVPNEDSD